MIAAIPMTSDRRKRKRVSVGFPVKVSGTGADGQPFQELSHTINISSGGVKFPSKTPLKTNDLVTVSLPLPKNMRPVPSFDYTYTSRGAVVRVDSTPGHPDTTHVVVMFVAAHPKYQHPLSGASGLRAHLIPQA